LPRGLGRIKAPTMLIWGESDRIVTPDYGRAYSRLIPGSRFELTVAAGHHSEIQQPQAFVERVSRFLKEQP
jgi:pimeloyl-ACP methyl ester carboxylesterase